MPTIDRFPDSLPPWEKPVPKPKAERGKRRCCWVHTNGGEVEGLIVSWAQESSGWLAQVARVEAGERMVLEWVPAVQVRPHCET